MNASSRQQPRRTPRVASGCMLFAVGLLYTSLGGAGCGAAEVAEAVPAEERLDEITGGTIFSAVADATVKSSNPSTNYGTSRSLEVDNSPLKRAYLRFAVTGLTQPVERATLRLYVLDGSADAPAVYSTSSTWTETKITWNSRPAPSGAALSDNGAVGANSWLEYDVSPAVTANGTYSFVLIGASSNGTDFSSRHASNPPQLNVVQASAGDPAPVVSCGDGSCSGAETCSSCAADCGACPPADTTAPELAFSVPAPDATVSATLSVLGTASDDVGVTKVELQIDGGAWRPATGTSSWSLQLDTTALVDGSHSLTARASDAVGNATTANVSFTVRNAPTCTPASCLSLGKNCGTVSDGCGGTLTCGSCTSPQTCGGNGIANECGLPPSSGWKQALYTDFENTTTLPAPWRAYNFANGNSGWGYYLASHVVVSNGTCKLVHSYESSGPGRGVSGFDSTTGAGWYQGTIKLGSDGSTAYAFTDYRVTTRMRIVSSPGIYSHRNLPLMWPWDGGPRNKGEQNLMEGRASPHAGTVGAFKVFLHYGVETGQDLQSYLPYPALDATVWHTYQVTRRAQRLTVQIDGAVVLDKQYTTRELRDYATHMVFQQEDRPDLRLARNGATTGSESIEIDSILVETPN